MIKYTPKKALETLKKWKDGDDHPTYTEFLTAISAAIQYMEHGLAAEGDAPTELSQQPYGSNFDAWQSNQLPGQTDLRDII